jgi:hypothetical protein
MRFLLAACLTLAAGGVQAARVDDLAVEHAKGVFTVRGTFILDAAPAAVRAALTDFDHLDRLTPAILESRLLERSAAGALVSTRSRACAGWFCRELNKVERVVVGEGAVVTIVATALPERSNVTMSVTRWRISAAGQGARVAWESSFDPEFMVPPLLGPALIKRALAREAAVHAAAIERSARQAGHAGG